MRNPSDLFSLGLIVSVSVRRLILTVDFGKFTPAQGRPDMCAVGGRTCVCIRICVCVHACACRRAYACLRVCVRMSECLCVRAYARLLVYV